MELDSRGDSADLDQASDADLAAEPQVSPAKKAAKKSAKKTVKKAAKKSAKRTTRKSSANKASAASEFNAQQQRWTFPKNTLEDALSVARAIEDQYAGKPMPAEMLGKALGYNRAVDWRFQDLLKSANLYGLVSGSGKTATVALEQIGQDVVAPGSPEQRQKALRAAFRNVPDFARVEDFYQRKRLPEDEFFENTLVREFNIARERVVAFKETFTRNLAFLRAFRAESGDNESTSQKSEEGEGLQQPSRRVLSNEPRATRTFLDTCFVMMPFGPWFDVYYKDVFHPAIKEAGLEPVRGDELFSTGSVIEQIWEQISKAKILLADLSGKNANVFYELGLAHAALKPVVLTAAALDDVPFDLRHLRVVIYDIKDPFWGKKLQDSLVIYLKNAKSDPGKSIPQPFRELLKEGSQQESEE